MTNRALILAALADGSSIIREPLIARDTLLMIDALRSLGTGIDISSGAITVTPAELAGPATVDCGLAGTVMRFVPAVAALATGPVTFDGDPRARERPMGPVIDALVQLDVAVDDGGRAALPFTLHGRGHVAADTVTIDASASSQFVSGLPSMPHIEMTVAMLCDRGIEVDADLTDASRAQWRVSAGAIAAVPITVEPDLSNAAPFLAAAAATGGTVTVAGWPSETTQAGDALRELLMAMGCVVTLDSRGLTVQGPARLSGIDVDLHDVGELTPVIAALAGLASPSSLRGIGHLRGHETDRLAALEADLSAVGVNARQTEDGLDIGPTANLSTLHGALWSSHDDHRMATAGAVIGLVVDGVRVDDIATTAKTLPDFVERWGTLVADGAR